jgi:hypothetical protein
MKFYPPKPMPNPHHALHPELAIPFHRSHWSRAWLFWSTAAGVVFTAIAVYYWVVARWFGQP